MSLTKNDIRDIEISIRNLIFDGSSRPVFKVEVNRVFRDLFGLDRGIDQREYMYIGDAFISNSRLAKESRVHMYESVGIDTLYDIFVGNEDDYQLIQAAVMLIATLRNDEFSEKRRSREDEILEKYNALLKKIKKLYGIKTRESMRSIGNPLKYASKLLKNFDDDDDYFSYFGDDDYYGGRNRKSRRRRDEDDEYGSYSDYCDMILEGTDYERKSRKKSKKSSKNRRDRDDDDDYDADDYDTDTADVIADNFTAVTAALERLADRMDRLESGKSKPKRKKQELDYEEYYDEDDYIDSLINEPEPAPKPKKKSASPASADILNSINSNIAKVATATNKNSQGISNLRNTMSAVVQNQNALTETVNALSDHVSDIDDIITSAMEDEDEDMTSNVQVLGPNIGGGMTTIDDLQAQMSSEDNSDSGGSTATISC